MEKVLDLDVQVKGNNNTNDSAGDERITSHLFFCSFGCEKTGSFNSFCC
ncbi:gallidermin/nisin family lantibiotic [Staphylococcus aureus]